MIGETQERSTCILLLYIFSAVYIYTTSVVILEPDAMVEYTSCSPSSVVSDL